MESSKNSMFIGMIEEKYGAKFSTVSKSPNVHSPTHNLQSESKTIKRKGRFLSTVKKMVRLNSSKLRSQTSHREAALRSGWDSSWKLKSESGERLGLSGKGWWIPPQDSFPIEFCQDTSLHGLKYIGQPERHMSERIFWFIAFVTSLSVAVWLITAMWTKYQQNPVIVSFQPSETNVDQIPFPAVTVCNMNKVMKTRAEDFITRALNGDEAARKDVYYLDHVCSSTKSFAKRFNFSQYGELTESQKERLNLTDPKFTLGLTHVNTFLRRAAQNCSDMIPFCVWQDKEMNCSKLFRPIETEFGKCCTFNMIPLSLLYSTRNDSRENPDEIAQWKKWDIDHDGLLLTLPVDELEFPRRQMKAGVTNGLSILLNVNYKEYYCTSSDSIGFRLATHLPYEIPKIADFGISLRPKAEIFVDVVPQITMAEPEIFAFDIDKRNCYKHGERKLEHYKYYSINNCVEECLANDTMAMCKCKRYYMPRTDHEQLCGPQNFECAEAVKFNKTKAGIRNTCNMCFASCTELDYLAQTTTTPLKPGIWTSPNGSESEWMQENGNNLSIVHVYVALDSVQARVRKELYGPTDLFANTGGLMGLCLGFSGLSLMEVIYFLTLRAWWKSQRKKAVVNERPKWATETVFSKEFDRANELTRNRNPDQPVSSYYRSIFGDIRKSGERQRLENDKIAY